VEEEYTLGKSFTERNRSFDGWTTRLTKVADRRENEEEKRKNKEELSPKHYVPKGH
jgi:hypothetical protein